MFSLIYLTDYSGLALLNECSTGNSIGGILTSYFLGGSSKTLFSSKRGDISYWSFRIVCFML